MGRPLLRYKDVIKRDLRSALIDTSAWGGHRQSPRYMAAKCQSGGFKGGTLESRLQARERRGKNTQPLCVFPQGTSAPCATETATPGSGYTVIQDPAQIPSANHCVFDNCQIIFQGEIGGDLFTHRGGKVHKNNLCLFDHKIN